MENIKNETLEEVLYERIEFLQKKVFGQTWPTRNIDFSIQEYCKLLGVEVKELLQETNYRAHKQLHSLDIPAIRQEIADIYIFTMAVSMTVFDDYHDLINEVDKKTQKNEVRDDWIINQ